MKPILNAALLVLILEMVALATVPVKQHLFTIFVGFPFISTALSLFGLYLINRRVQEEEE
jgi:hypothetical protein